MGLLKDTMMCQHHIAVSDEQEDKLLAYLRGIMEVNKNINLTRILSEESGIVLHIEDSLAALPYIENAPSGVYVDLGTGGGFPGVPVHIMSGRKTVLVDSVQKKLRAIEPVIRSIGIEDGVSYYAGRIEDLARKHRGEFAIATARALTSLPALLELSSPLLIKGGRLICFKAQPSAEELHDADYVASLVGLELVKDESFLLSDESQRRFLVYEKVGKGKIKLPRNIGMAQKHPLSERNNR